MSMQEWDWESQIFPTPRERKQSAEDTMLKPGDIVKILVGPATGMLGIVVVERNENYADYEPDVNPDAIGVKVAEESVDGSAFPELIDALTQRPNRIKTVTRWFDDLTQLEIIQKVDKQ